MMKEGTLGRLDCGKLVRLCKVFIKRLGFCVACFSSPFFDCIICIGSREKVFYLKHRWSAGGLEVAFCFPVSLVIDTIHVL